MGNQPIDGGNYLFTKEEMDEFIKAEPKSAQYFRPWLGADEFITKPYRKERLLARIANVLRRYEGRSNMLEGPGFLLDRGTYTLYVDGTSVLLPKNQGKILETLLMEIGKPVPKQTICEAVWGTSEFIDENALQVNLTRLKKTLSGLPLKVRITAERGVGYKLEALP